MTELNDRVAGLVALPSHRNTHTSLLFWPCRAARGILVLRPRIEPAPPAVEVQSLNHWTAREVTPPTGL